MKRIVCLDSMRFIMVMAIVLCHFDFFDVDGLIGQIWNLVFSRPDPAVAFFFILSGFGLEYSQKKFGYPSFSVRFAVERIKKLYPIYMFSILLCVPVTLYFAISLHGWADGVVRTIMKIPLALVLLQSVTGMAGFSHAFNGVCWFFSTLFVLYMFYPILHRLNTRLRLKGGGGRLFLLLLIALLVRLGAYWVLSDIENSSVFSSYFDDLSYGSPYFRIFDFILGMLLYNLYNNYRECAIFKSSTWEVFVMLLFVLYYIFRDVVGLSSSVQIFLDAALPVLMIFIFSFQKGVISRCLSSKYWQKLGAITMYIFFFHYVAVLYVKAFVGSISITFSPIITILISLVLILLITYMTMLLWNYVCRIVSK